MEEEDNIIDETKGEVLTEKKKVEDKEQTPNIILQTKTLVSDTETEMDQEMTPSEMEMEDKNFK